MEAYWNHIRRADPYTPGEQPKEKGAIKLNTNENPYPPSPLVKESLGQMGECLRLYPDPAASPLVEAIAGYKGLSKEQVFAGVGSDDVLAMCFLTFFQGTLPILFPDITYSFYDVWARLFRIPYKVQPLREDFSIDPGDYRKPNGGILFPNPNAPTGIDMGLGAVEEIVGCNPDSVVIVDEAYVDFGAESALYLLEKYKNLLVVQTFSKSRSLAGARIGYAMGDAALIKALNDVKYSFNSYTMNQPSIAMGTAAVRDEAYFQETRRKIMDTREWFRGEMEALGFAMTDSRANFVFASHPQIPAAKLFEAAKKEHIYVRYFNKPRIDNYLRITIGTREEMEAFLDFLKSFIGKAILV